MAEKVPSSESEEMCFKEEIEDVFVKEEPMEDLSAAPAGPSCEGAEERLQGDASSLRTKEEASEDSGSKGTDEQHGPGGGGPHLPGCPQQPCGQCARTMAVRREFAHLKKYFLFSVDAKDKVEAKCSQRTCGNVLKMQQNTVYNLKRHYKSHHRSLLNELRAAIEAGSKRGRHFSRTRKPDSGLSGMPTHSQKRRRQSSIEPPPLEPPPLEPPRLEPPPLEPPRLEPPPLEPPPVEPPPKKEYNRVKAVSLFYKFIIQDMVPSNFTGSERFRDLLNFLRPEFPVPSRMKQSQDLKVMGAMAKVKLMHQLRRQKYVATTADSWIVDNRGFLGMTVHWIDAKTLRRQKAVLGCREVPGTPTGEFFARTICKMHRDFAIQDKVQTMTTDNGANYVDAFEHYSVEAQRQLLDAQVDAADYMVEHGQEPDPEELPLPEDGDLGDPVAVSVTDALDNVKQNPNTMEGFFNQGIKLPKHRRCGSHSINLLATKDTAKVANWTTSPNPAFVETLVKATAVWTCRDMRTAAAYHMRDILKKKLRTPGDTRWNTRFVALKWLLEQLQDPQNFIGFKELLQCIPNVSVFVEEDLTIIKEYVRVMEPVVACLDALQAEEKVYMGAFLPSLFIMKLKLEKLQSDGNLRHAKHLVEALLGHNGRQGFEARFGHLFEDDDLLMATALHPVYKLVAVKNMTKSSAKTDTIQRRLVEELAAKSGVEEREASVEDDPFLQALRQHDMDDMEAGQEDTSKKILNDIQAWSWRPIKVSMELKGDIFPQDHRAAWMELFIKYNTPLPSSAAVERLFSLSSDVLRVKRSCLTAENFENLIFLKGNLDIIQQHMMCLKSQEEEEQK